MAKYLLISGSPRKGNTDFVLSEIYKKLNGEKELIFLRNLNFNHCKGCLVCFSTGTSNCVIKDDMTKLFKDLAFVDLIIIGSPLYYGGVSGLMKQFIDRTLPALKSKSLKNKRLISIMVGADKTQITERFHKKAIEGLVKHNELNLIDIYNFEAFEASDLKQNPKSTSRINKIIEKINSL